MSRKSVVSVTRSKENRNSFILKLSCGHEITVFRSHNFDMKKVRCQQCMRGIPPPR